jgi:hypothetical protein
MPTADCSLGQASLRAAVGRSVCPANQQQRRANERGARFTTKTVSRRPHLPAALGVLCGCADNFALPRPQDARLLSSPACLGASLRPIYACPRAAHAPILGGGREASEDGAPPRPRGVRRAASRGRRSRAACANRVTGGPNGRSVCASLSAGGDDEHALRSGARGPLVQSRDVVVEAAAVVERFALAATGYPEPAAHALRAGQCEREWRELLAASSSRNSGSYCSSMRAGRQRRRCEL